MRCAAGARIGERNDFLRHFADASAGDCRRPLFLPATGGRTSNSSTGPGRSKSITLFPNRFPGALPSATAQSRCTSAAHLKRSPQLNMRWRTAGRPNVPSFSPQPTLFDSSRAPEDKHILWAYCHVPNGSTVDMTERIEAQIERFAPGFRDCILSRRVSSPVALEAMDANLIGGDIMNGAMNLRQLFFRPTLGGYSTGSSNLYFCSASTPPGGGVHGMCGYHAAQLALRRLKMR